MSTMTESKCQVTVYIATSKDGYIADKNGSVDWLNNCIPKVAEGEDSGISFEELLNSVDAIVMGRKTFESCLQLCRPIGPYPWPYGNTPLVVLTSNKDFKVPTSLNSVSLGSGDPNAVLSDLKARLGAKDVYVDGGMTIRRFFEAGLVHRVIVTKVPVALGEGVPLFHEDQWKRLEEVESKPYGDGWCQTLYKVKNSS